MRIVARLIEAENDRDRRTRIGWFFPFYYRDWWLAFAKARSQSQFPSAIKIAKRLQQFFVLPMRESDEGCQRAKDELKIAGPVDFSGEALRVCSFTVIGCVWRFCAPFFLSDVFSLAKDPLCVSRLGAALRRKDFFVSDSGR